MTHAKTLTDLLAIADRAVQVHQAEVERKQARSSLNSAYRQWKGRNHIGELHRESEEWDQMMVATKAEFEVLERAKRRERNARKRLSDAVIRSGQGTRFIDGADDMSEAA